MTTSSPPLVTIVVPARNESDDIEACLTAIAAQDHPGERLEVIVVDGCSGDATAHLARRALAGLEVSSTAVISNPGGITSSNLNAGVARAAGEIVCRVDARTRIEPHYVRSCAEVLVSRPEVAVVGGSQVALARDSSARATGIARALNNRWGMGGSRYRRSTASGPSDTVYLGAFRRRDLIEVGGWDERLVSNQDFDLNRRMGARGVVWYEATLRSGYVPRRTLVELWRQYRRFGRAKVRYWRHASARPERRQWALMLGPPAAALALVLGLLWLPNEGRAALVVGALVFAFVIEAWGSTGPQGPIASRVVSVLAMAVIGAGWWLGVVQEVLTPSPEHAGSDLRAPAS